MMDRMMEALYILLRFGFSALLFAFFFPYPLGSSVHGDA
jgi:hypothetical protein